MWVNIITTYWFFFLCWSGWNTFLINNSSSSAISTHFYRNWLFIPNRRIKYVSHSDKGQSFHYCWAPLNTDWRICWRVPLCGMLSLHQCSCIYPLADSQNAFCKGCHLHIRIELKFVYFMLESTKCYISCLSFCWLSFIACFMGSSLVYEDYLILESCVCHHFSI